jgi:ABC-type Mn2+/Zn2+ transport system permease subunit
MGDAISHGILPGLAIAFITTQSKALFPMFIGACGAGLLCSFCIEWLHKKTLLKWMRLWDLPSPAFLLRRPLDYSNGK